MNGHNQFAMSSPDHSKSRIEVTVNIFLLFEQSGLALSVRSLDKRP